MNTRIFVLLTAVLIYGCGGGGSSETRVVADSASVEPPTNVLLITVDDLNDWVGYMGGHSQAQTPNIDSLAARGTAYMQAQTASPLCKPSRTAFLTGLKPHKTRVFQNGSGDFRDTLPLHITMPEAFKVNGYLTVGAGKVFHGKGDPQSYDEYWPSMKQVKPPFIRPDHLPLNNKGDFGNLDWGPLPNSIEGFSDRKIARFAAEWLSIPHTERFFFSIGFYSPHLPLYTTQEILDRFPRDSVILPKVYTNDRDDLPPRAISTFPTRDHDALVEADAWKDMVSAYLAMISMSDDNVGIVLDALAAGPHADNTMVILISDHGWHLGEKGHWRKNTLWAESTRVPMVIYRPGQTAEVVSDVVSLLDIYPTLVDVFDLKGIPELDGESLYTENRELGTAYVERGQDFYAIITNKWHYIHYPKNGGEELYNRKRDPQQLDNLMLDPRYNEIAETLRGHVL